MSRLPERPRAVVTGAASGLGRAIAVALAERGGRVIVADVHAERAAETAALVARAGGVAEVVACDVRDPAALVRCADAAERLWGGTDVLVNNAGVAVAGPIGELPLDDWKWIVEINLWGVIHGCHVFAPRMKKAGGGWILNVASSAAFGALPEMAPYNVTKAGVLALSETLYGELDKDGIRVACLCPTFFKTNLLETARTASAKARRLAEKMFEKSKVTAEQVAHAGLDGLERGELVIIPQLDGRFLWALKRYAPGAYHRIMRATHTKNLLEKLGGRRA